MILEDFSIRLLRNVLNMASFENKKCVLPRSENRESEPTAFELSFQSLQILAKISTHIFLEHSKFAEIYDVQIGHFVYGHFVYGHFVYGYFV